MAWSGLVTEVELGLAVPQLTATVREEAQPTLGKMLVTTSEKGKSTPGKAWRAGKVRPRERAPEEVATAGLGSLMAPEIGNEEQVQLLQSQAS